MKYLVSKWLSFVRMHDNVKPKNMDCKYSYNQFVNWFWVSEYCVFVIYWWLSLTFLLANIHWSYELRTFVVEIVVFIYCILFPRMTLCTLPCVFIIIEIANFFSVKLYTLHIRFHSNSSIPCKQKGVWDVVHPIEDSDKTGNTKPQNCRSFKVL